jgi:hypothetical protein
MASMIIACAPESAAGSSQVEAPQGEGQPGNISVFGFGEALGQPDKAQVTVGVETFAQQVNDATAQNETSITAILDALERAGIDSEDIQTSNYSLWAEQIYGDRGSEGIAGYHVSNQVTVLIRDVDAVDEVLAAAAAAGANNIYGVQFSVANPAALQAEARERALEDARHRAESLAQLSGLTLGSVQAINEFMGQVPRPYALADLGGDGGFEAGSGEASSSINPGQLSYQVQVHVRYTLMLP